jgi:glutamate synthase domain-containing protein 1/glutamate synthase domain-containing protein 3
MNKREIVSKLIHSRRSLVPDGGYIMPEGEAAEGGCGVIGMASNVQLAAKHMLESLTQMRNRGNGKGGGIAAVGLVPEEFGVTQQILENDYLLSVAYLDTSVRQELEEAYIESIFLIDHVVVQNQIADFTSLEGLDVRPPEVVHYFVRIKSEIVSTFIEENGMKDVPSRRIEDEIVFQNTYRLNTTYYMSTGEKQAFVLSHGKNMLVLKMVGYGDDVIRYYQLENIHAHVWIGHHRYPTKGRVWHPGGAHPFIGMNEALVHNGDFANHASISEYLAQRNIYPLFLTDTEVAVQVFDLLHRIYDYPLEYVIEAMAPTTERDFTQLPEEKQSLYRSLQVSHMHCSPDGPWFFLITQSDTHAESGPEYRLTGITDTSMLRPQVFAWQEQSLETGEKVAIGLAASEKQGIDAAMLSLSETDDRFWPRADRYWNARGGSHTDGGAFIFEIKDYDGGMPAIKLYDKFGKRVPVPNSSSPYSEAHGGGESHLKMPDFPVNGLFAWYLGEVKSWTYADLGSFLMGIINRAGKQYQWDEVIALLTLMLNRRYSTGSLRRSSVLVQIDNALEAVFEQLSTGVSQDYIGISHRQDLPVSSGEMQAVILDAGGYQPEGESSVSRELHRLYGNGFRKFIVTHARGHRFIGAGFGPESSGVRIDVYGSSGDYLGSGLDGLEIHVHNNGQDQLAQIMKAGKLVVHGDVGQTFMYGAKGGEAYILGNAAGRPLINAVGKPRVVINGTCLDYLAESFMAGNPLKGGGFVILNGIQFDLDNQIVELETPYPGGNLFSLASGGAIYLRDPKGLVTKDQLNGGEFTPFTSEDWTLILPYLEENERLFDIPLETLLTVEGELKSPEQVYRKIQPLAVRALQAEESWVVKSH